MFPNNIGFSAGNMNSLTFSTTQQPQTQLFTSISGSSSPSFFPKVDAQAAAGEKVPSILFSNSNNNDDSDDDDWGYGSPNFNKNSNFPLGFHEHGSMIPKMGLQKQGVFDHIQEVSIPWKSSSNNWSQVQSKAGNEVYYTNSAGKSVKKPDHFIPGLVKLKIQPKNINNTLFNPNNQISIAKLNLNPQQQLNIQQKDDDQDSINESKNSVNDDDCSEASQQSSDWSCGSKKESIFQDKNPDSIVPTNAVVPKLELNNVSINQHGYKGLFEDIDGMPKTNIFKSQDFKPAQIIFGHKKEEVKPPSNMKDLIDPQQKPAQITAYQLFFSQTKKQEQKAIFSNKSQQTVKLEKRSINNSEQCEALKQRVKQLEQLNKQYLTIIESLSETVKNLSIAHKMSSTTKAQETILIKKSPNNEKTLPKVNDQQLKKKSVFDDSQDD